MTDKTGIHAAMPVKDGHAIAMVDVTTFLGMLKYGSAVPL